MSNLFGGNSSDEDDAGFKTNKDYAKSYNKYRQKELLKHLKDKEQNASDSSSESDSSEDDENAYDPKFDEDFFKTLSSLKRKDPTIYERETKFFENATTNAENDGASTAKTKKLTVKQYEHNMLMETGGLSDPDDADTSNQRSASPSYYDEQKQIKSEFKQVLETNDSEDDDTGDFAGLFTKREKTKQEQDHDDAEQEQWLQKHSAVKEENINEIWSGKKLSKDDKFLRDYILSNGYADKDDDEIPTYDEIVADDDFEEQQTEFEHKYNFRFEDPDQEFIKRYPRTIDSSVRKVDSRRKEKRVERRERKDQEKKEKFQEVEMLKEFKRKEIEEKLEQLRAVTGTDEINIDEIDLDGDFDPDEYDKKMSKLFDNDYYQIEDGDEKPEAPSHIEDLQVENFDDYDGQQQNDGGAHCEDGDFNMDCDYDETAGTKNFQREMIDNTLNKQKRRKRRSKFMEMLETKKPTFNPDDTKSYGQHLDEFYKLDCEDIIGDVKCRFKYVETVPCDYGLSFEEILMAKNRELNAWASLKKATQIRSEHVERNEQLIFQKKSRNEMLKRKILTSLFEPSDDEEPADDSIKKADPLKSKVGNGDSQKESTIDSNKKKKKKNKKAGGDENNKPFNGKCNDIAAESNLSKATTVAAESVAGECLSSRAETKTDSNSVEIPKVPVSIAVTLKKTEQNKPPKIATKTATTSTAIDRFTTKREGNKLKKTLHKTIAKPSKQKANGLTDERLRAFGINPKKFEKQQKYGASSSNMNQNHHKRAQPKQNINPKDTKNKKFKQKLAKALNV